MVVRTRRSSRLELLRLIDDLPEELWVLVSAHLSPKHLPAFLLTCRNFAKLSKRCWEAVCKAQYPEWTVLISKHIGLLRNTDYRQCCVLFSHRAKDNQARIDVDALIKKQTNVNRQHRAVLCEWLTEVGQEMPLSRQG
jgi:F-box domain